jgi:Flp pilus assembly pilin Flp
LFGQIINLRAQSLDEDGQALVEYSLILLLVALVAVPALSQIGVNIISPLTTAADAL